MSSSLPEPSPASSPSPDLPPPTPDLRISFLLYALLSHIPQATLTLKLQTRWYNRFSPVSTLVYPLSGTGHTRRSRTCRQDRGLYESTTCWKPRCNWAMGQRSECLLDMWMLSAPALTSHSMTGCRKLSIFSVEGPNCWVRWGEWG